MKPLVFARLKHNQIACISGAKSLSRLANRIYQVTKIKTNVGAGTCLTVCAVSSIFLCLVVEPIWARRALFVGGWLLLQVAPILAVAFGPEKSEDSVRFTADYWLRSVGRV